MHKWTEQDTLTLIKVRVEKDNLFTGRRHTAKKAWEEILKALGLGGSVTPTQIGKKWDNLKRKYKELRCPPTGGSTSTEAVQSQATVEDEEATESGSDSQECVEPSTSAAPPTRKKRKSPLLQFLEAEAVKEEDRFNRIQAASEEASAKFLKLFEELVRKE
ncbi:hypothetical protein CgunFtcFv8_026672 [Champsocephalus gunnari]|uniref:Myb/SANT-like DNA-binding domain-containing protein n=1 Tax=Champsocephalus gunnari TaxID=52237 RepID=A0AAN8DXC0_CHAGU|nr:hypothetical protein CgunFtcFv8_026672 [Champsocephalus gunnari]